MKNVQRLFLGWIVLIVVSSRGIASAQSSPDAQRAEVVKLRVHRANQSSDETAAGLFVGKDQQRAYFITAYHAIKADEQRGPVQSVQIQFFGSPQNFSATVLENFNAELDLGVVSTAIANLPPELPKILRKDVSVTPISIIGHPAGGFWRVWPGNVQSEIVSVTDIHRFLTSRDDSLAEGFSGGAVLDSSGAFLGMHTSTDRKYGFAAKSREIVDQLAAWQVPADNLTDVRPESEVDAIKRVLRQYEEAYNQRDTNALWKIWPDPPPTTKGAIEKSFPAASSISMKVQYNDSAVKIDGTTAIVNGQFAQLFTPRVGDTHTREGTIIFKLKKNVGVWTIVEVQ